MLEVMRSIPSGVRQVIYGGYAVVTFVIGGIQVWASANDEASPDWIQPTLAVLAYAAIGLGVTAAANVNNPDPPDGGAPLTGGSRTVRD